MSEAARIALEGDQLRPRVDVVLAPRTARTAHLLMQVSGHLLAREQRLSCWDAEQHEPDRLLRVGTLLLVADADSRHQSQLDELADGWQRRLFTNWSARPLEQLSFCLLMLGDCPRTEWCRRLRATLAYFGATELLAPAHYELPIGAGVRNWISNLGQLLGSESALARASWVQCTRSMRHE